MSRLRGLLCATLLAGCATPPAPPPPAPERYRDAWLDFQAETDDMIRSAGRNRLRVEGSAGRARGALETMGGLLEGAPAARLAELAGRYSSLSRAIAAGNAVSSGQERALTAIRDEVARDFDPSAVAVVSKEPPPPAAAPPDAFARWEAAHTAFAAHARGGENARLVQDYSDLRAALEGFAASETDRIRAERFLREYERLAERAATSQLVERDLKEIDVLETDIRATFGERK